MKKYLLLVLTLLLIACSKKTETVETTQKLTATPEIVESVKATEIPMEEEVQELQSLDGEVVAIKKEKVIDIKVDGKIYEVYLNMEVVGDIQVGSKIKLTLAFELNEDDRNGVDRISKIEVIQ